MVLLLEGVYEVKRVIVKRLLYRNVDNNHLFYGGEEYDGHLSAENILSSIYTVNKHIWSANRKSLYQLDMNGKMQYQIYVESFEYCEKSWYNLFIDDIKRILGF